LIARAFDFSAESCDKLTVVSMSHSLGAAIEGRFVAYYRVSTDKQGDRGYGLEGQRKAVADYLNGGNWRLVANFTEIESGRRTDNRPELEKALVTAKKHKATLILAKLDRLARNVAFIAGLMERKVDFVCCDMPNATPFMLHVYAAVAEEERRMIAARTKAGLAAAKANGVELGNAQLAADNHAAAVARAKSLKPILRELRDLSARATAAELNARKVATPTGAPWSAKTVIRVRERVGLQHQAGGFLGTRRSH
jgi:DNA invertase Pin-like site-specific DNA recombinase